jgi:hypothetical protein
MGGSDIAVFWDVACVKVAVEVAVTVISFFVGALGVTLGGFVVGDAVPAWVGLFIALRCCVDLKFICKHKLNVANLSLS